ncbi:MAG: hypothetical protein NZ583_00830 [Desulfobacterota bacterium]|nr:hypothetical protein [Thermodesulfobacteriota bacterium]MDW8001259.1 uroporphyrinogen decarboxylase family protein [Deltaproteobacteria bacterium]
MTEKKELVRKALSFSCEPLPRLPKGELFIFDEFLDSFVPEKLGLGERIARLSWNLGLDLVPFSYDRLDSLDTTDLKILSEFFLVLNIPGPFSYSVSQKGYLETLKILGRDPKRFLLLVEEHLFRVLSDLPKIKEKGFDGISIVDDIAGTSGLLFSFRIFDSMIKPFLEKVTMCAKSEGLYVFFHSDGYVEEILPFLVELKIDCLSTWDQQAHMDIYAHKDRFFGNVSFMGTIDLLSWDEKKIIEEIKREEAEFSSGGLILGSSLGLSKEIPIGKLSLLYPKIKHHIR